MAKVSHDAVRWDLTGRYRLRSILSIVSMLAANCQQVGDMDLHELECSSRDNCAGKTSSPTIETFPPSMEPKR
jgi:hypothetical protein